MAGKVIGIGILLELIDKVTGPAGRIKSQFGNLQISAQQLGMGMVKLGAIMTATGAAMSYFSLKVLSSTFGSKKALGELASLGIKDLDLIEKKAMAAANQFADVAMPRFITAAYDIKSAISNLSDSAVADYTYLTAITAKATKGTVEQMGDLYATAYGIYKELFSKLTDIRFAEVLSGAIAITVREFKMTGPKLAEYVSLLGASATKQLVPLAEQFAIGGLLGATMSGSEAATKYGAFLKQPVKAARALGLSFTDANNRLLPMADILDLIRGKFGDYIDAVEKGQLMEAFGRIEGVKLVELLIDKTDELRYKTSLIQNAMGQGAKAAIDMAEVIDRPIGQRWIILKQQLHAIAEILGNALIPTAKKVIGVFSQIALNIQKFLEAHPRIIKFGMIFITLAGSVLFLLGSLIALGGVTILTVVSLSGLAILLPIIKAGILGIAAAGISLITNPVFLAISALILGAYLIIKHWDKVGPFLSKVVGGIASAFFWLWNQIMIGVKWLISLPGKFYDAGKNMIISLWEGIKAVAMWPVNQVKDIVDRIKRYLPLSPALEGPFRTPPEKYGEAISSGIARGIDKGKSDIDRAINVMTNIIRDSLHKVSIPLADITAVVIPPIRKMAFASVPADITAVAIPPTLPSWLPESLFRKLPAGGGGGIIGGGGGDTGVGGLEGGLGGIGGGIVSYFTQHFERGSIIINANRLDFESFANMVAKAVERKVKGD